MDSLTFIILTTLALTRSVVIRRNVLSRFCSRSSLHRTSLHCRIRYFIQDPRGIWWYRWFTLIAVNSASYDFRSHAPKWVAISYSSLQLFIIWFACNYVNKGQFPDNKGWNQSIISKAVGFTTKLPFPNPILRKITQNTPYLSWSISCWNVLIRPWKLRMLWDHASLRVLPTSQRNLLDFKTWK